MIKFSLVLIIMILVNSLQAQQTKGIIKVNAFYSYILLETHDNEVISIGSDGTHPLTDIKYTSFTIQIQEPLTNPLAFEYKPSFGAMGVLYIPVSKVSDASVTSSVSSSLHVFSIPQTSLVINTKGYKGCLKLNLFYAPPLKDVSELKKLFKADNKCDKPPMISYTVWREGLPNPKPPRLKTDVEHLVVHHSAGNNNDTNYINTVRNIYLLHTQSNGWDDIGYNFLIAANGMVFNGRDPQGVADDDDIHGAHFCGKNENTMGVCMMGNYMNVKPTYNALKSLEYLLAWKLKKDRLNAFGQSKHPKETGVLLNAVCGHRDGCNTDCPGDSLYALLPYVKTQAAKIADSCGLVLATKTVVKEGSIVLFPNPNSGTLTVHSDEEYSSFGIKIYGLAGNLHYEGSFTNDIPFQVLLPEGMYFYMISVGSYKETRGNLIIQKK